MRRQASAAVVGFNKGWTISLLGVALALALLFAAAPAKAVAPTVTIENASGVSYTSATGKGTINVNGSAWVYYEFQHTPQSMFEAQGWEGADSTSAGYPYVEGVGDRPVELSLNRISPGTTYRLRLKGENIDGEVTYAEAPSTFTTPPVALPTALSIDAATDVSYTSAKVSGSVERPAGPADPAFDTHCRFDYVTADQYAADGFAGASSTSCDGSPLTAVGPAAVEADLTGLAPGTTFHYRVTASNAGGEDSVEAPSTFTTLPVAKPTVTLDPISAIGLEGAHFSAEIDTNSPEAAPAGAAVETAFVTSWRFECTPECPGLTPGVLSADEEAGEIEIDAKDLEPNTQYEVKLIASNAGGEVVAERTFSTTNSAPGAFTGLVANLMPTSARLLGFVNPRNQASTYYFEWGVAPNLSDAQSLPASGDASAGSTGRSAVAARDLSGLQPNTTYYFRLVAENASGLTKGEIRSFATRPAFPALGDGLGADGDRGLELVSTPEKQGNPVTNGIYAFDGETAIWSPRGGTPESSFGPGLLNALISTRTVTGWETRSAYPSQQEFPYLQPSVSAGDDDLSSLLIKGGPEFALFPAGKMQYFEFQPSSGAGPVAGPSWDYPVESGGLAITGQSADFRHILAAASFEGVPGDRPGINPGSELPWETIYDFGSAGREMVGFLPGEEPIECGLPYYALGAGFHRTRARQNLVSRDGKRFFFRAATNANCDEPLQLYMREAGPSGGFGAGDGATTTLISEPLPSEPKYEARFIQATADGSEVFYVSQMKLEAGDDNDALDLYRYTVGVGNECLTCVVPETGMNLGQPIYAPATVVAEDGSRAYFESPRVLAQGAVAGQVNLYVLRIDSGEIDYIAALDSENTLLGGGELGTSRDGTTFFFRANAPDRLKELVGAETMGQQYYVYDDDARSLTCASCANGDASGAVSVGDPGVFAYRNEPLSADGSRFVFSTEAALVSSDVNGEEDAYEWHDGRLGLLTDGVSTSSLRVLVSGVTPSGRDVFFVAHDQTEGTDRTTQFYDARIGGGFGDDVVPPAPCGGDGCQGPPSAPPAEGSAGSAQFSGPGNPTAKRPSCAKGKKKKKGRCVKARAKKQKPKKQGRGQRAGADKGGRK